MNNKIAPSECVLAEKNGDELDPNKPLAKVLDVDIGPYRKLEASCPETVADPEWSDDLQLC